MLQRHITEAVQAAAAQSPVVTVMGPRQSGKTTLCRALFPEHEYISLEAPDVRLRALEDPRGLLDLGDDVVIDEVQRAPDLLSYIQVAVDEDPRPGRFILTGSQNLLLMQSVSQTLAGRTALLTLYPFTLRETLGLPPFDIADSVSAVTLDAPVGERWEALFAGFFPRIHDQRLSPREWLGDYLRTYVERDLREVLQVADTRSFENFVRLAAASTAQELNLNRMASDIGVGQQTARRWLSALETGFLAVTLPPPQRQFPKASAETSPAASAGHGTHLLSARHSGRQVPGAAPATRRNLRIVRCGRTGQALCQPTARPAAAFLARCDGARDRRADRFRRPSRSNGGEIR